MLHLTATTDRSGRKHHLVTTGVLDFPADLFAVGTRVSIMSSKSSAHRKNAEPLALAGMAVVTSASPLGSPHTWKIEVPGSWNVVDDNLTLLIDPRDLRSGSELLFATPSPNEKS